MTLKPEEIIAKEQMEYIDRLYNAKALTMRQEEMTKEDMREVFECVCRLYPYATKVGIHDMLLYSEPVGDKFYDLLMETNDKVERERLVAKYAPECAESLHRLYVDLFPYSPKTEKAKAYCLRKVDRSYLEEYGRVNPNRVRPTPEEYDAMSWRERIIDSIMFREIECTKDWAESFLDRCIEKHAQRMEKGEPHMGWLKPEIAEMQSIPIYELSLFMDYGPSNLFSRAVLTHFWNPKIPMETAIAEAYYWHFLDLQHIAEPLYCVYETVGTMMEDGEDLSRK
ncbi:MAG: hypothetical protein Q4D07_02730 [Selenomonadaceae bacterium]|nr:hypothetical protein [Selenomonadaceae bacterium]